MGELKNLCVSIKITECVIPEVVVVVVVVKYSSVSQNRVREGIYVGKVVNLLSIHPVSFHQLLKANQL